MSVEVPLIKTLVRLYLTYEGLKLGLWRGVKIRALSLYLTYEGLKL